MGRRKTDWQDLARTRARRVMYLELENTRLTAALEKSEGEYRALVDKVLDLTREFARARMSVKDLNHEGHEEREWEQGPGFADVFEGGKG